MASVQAMIEEGMYWMYLIVVVVRRKDDCEASRGLFGVWSLEAMALSEAGLARLPQASIPWYSLASLLDGTRLTHHPQGPQGLIRDQPLPHPPSPLSPDSDCSRTHSPPSVPKKADVWGCLSCRCLSIGSLWRPPPFLGVGTVRHSAAALGETQIETAPAAWGLV